jgi:integral membrane protein
MKNHLRTLGFIEGASMLLLLFIAMPIKYIGGNPEPVRWVGSIHGGLFLLFIFGATQLARRESWPKQRLILAYIASTIPFGPFVFDRKLFPGSSPQ